MQRKKYEEQMCKLLLEDGWEEVTTLGDALPPIGFFKREHRIDFDCTEANSTNRLGNTSRSCRIDFILNVNGVFVFLEVDESQHRFGYDATLSCDSKRMCDVMHTIALAGDERMPPPFWIRYNPMAWHKAGSLLRVDTRLRQRFFTDLLGSVQHSDELRIGYAFYDLDENDDLEVLQNEEFSETLASCAFNLTPPDRFPVRAA